MICWYFYFEFELYLIVVMYGKYFVGDYIGLFGFGYFVLFGLNLLYNWVSDMVEGEIVECCNFVIQFDLLFVCCCMDVFFECCDVQVLFDDVW